VVSFWDDNDIHRVVKWLKKLGLKSQEKRREEHKNSYYTSKLKP